MLLAPQALAGRWRAEPPQAVAGNGLEAHALTLCADGLLDGVPCHPQARPRARALLEPALHAWAAGEAVDAAQALPLYVRNKVAQTTAEREAAALAAAAPAGSSATAAAATSALATSALAIPPGGPR